MTLPQAASLNSLNNNPPTSLTSPGQDQWDTMLPVVNVSASVFALNHLAVLSNNLITVLVLQHKQSKYSKVMLSCTTVPCVYLQLSKNSWVFIHLYLTAAKRIGSSLLIFSLSPICTSFSLPCLTILHLSLSIYYTSIRLFLAPPKEVTLPTTTNMPLLLLTERHVHYVSYL